MDVGPQPKLALLLSLTLMNLVAIGICIYAPSPINERTSSGDIKKRLILKKRVSAPVNDEVVDVKTEEARNNKISDGDQLKDGTESAVASPQSPAIENSDAVLVNASITTDTKPTIDSPLDENVKLEETKTNLNVIAINTNFGNDSSKEGSDDSLTDLCGHGAEMRFTPQDVSKSVTVVVAKSFKLVDTLNKKVVPALENFNDQIARTAHFEKSLDSCIAKTINAAICPAVITMSDNINKVNDKINRLTEKVSRPNALEGRSVSCQVSESFLMKSVRKKNSFFNTINPTRGSRIADLFCHVNYAMFTTQKGRTAFKASTAQYWANRKRLLMRKLRKTQQRENMQIDNASRKSVTQEELTVKPASNFSDSNQELKTDEASSTEFKLKEEGKDKTFVLVVQCNDGEELTKVISNETKLSDKMKDECIPEDPFHEDENVPSQLSHLPSYLSSYEDFEGQRSASIVAEQCPINVDCNFGGKDDLEHSFESKVPQQCSVSVESDSENNLSFITASEFLNDDYVSGVAQRIQARNSTMLEGARALQLSASVRSTMERICGPLNSRRGLQEAFNVLDPNLERNTVENLLLLISKIFDAWSESQLSIVPSRALSRVYPSESRCVNPNFMQNKSATSFENSIDIADRLRRPDNYESSIETIDSEAFESGKISEIYEKKDVAIGSLVQGVVGETLSRSPESTEIEVFRSSQFDDISSMSVPINAPQHFKAVLYKEQYSIARKVASECIERALSVFDVDSSPVVLENRRRDEKMELADSELATPRTSSEESFYSWAPDSSSDDYSYHECDGSATSREGSCEKSSKNMSHNRVNSRKGSQNKEQEVKEDISEAQCSSHNVCRVGTGAMLATSSLESWMLTSTSGDGVEIRNCCSELKSEGFSEVSMRPISYTTEDTSDGESNHSLVETTASESSNVQIRRNWSSRFTNKIQRKRPKTPKSSVASSETPIYSHSVCAIKVAESLTSRNASLSDEN